MFILFLALFYSGKKKIYLFLLYPKHVIKLSKYNLGCYSTFPIGNLIFGFELDFSQTCLLLNKESHKGFISYFVLSFKKLNKISGDFNFLLRNIYFFSIKSESRHRVGTHVKNVGP